MAVGYDIDEPTDSSSSGFEDAMAEEWDGSTWTLEPSVATEAPGSESLPSELSSVACPSVTGCVAVGSSDGYTEPLAETWNGVSWTVAAVPTVAGTSYATLTSVSCATATLCIAVGYSATATASTYSSTGLVDEWDGSVWTAVTTPANAVNDSELTAVSCVAGPECLAVGQQGTAGGGNTPFAEAWDGTTWTTVPTAALAGDSLNGVACSSAASCVVVGQGSDQSDLLLAATWSDMTWTVDNPPIPVAYSGGNLVSVACRSVDSCTAVGSYDPDTSLIEQWNGTAWTVSATPATPAGPSEFDGVAYSSASAVIAVGSASNPDVYGPTALAEQSVGSAWQIMNISGPTGPTGQTNLLSVACPLPSSCVAVGYSSFLDETDSAALDFPIAAQWNGTTWTLMDVPAPVGQVDSELTAVSCSSPTACVAVGEARSGGELQAIADEWDGTAWSPMSVPQPPGDAVAELTGVSCQATDTCVAVGISAPSQIDFNQATLAETFNGTTWSIVPSPTYYPDDSTAFYAVSCSSSTACIAVGNENQSSPLGAEWDGSAWMVQSVPGPPNQSAAELVGVSCPTTTSCVAVGSQNGSQEAFVDSWDGTSWTDTSPPYSDQGFDGAFTQVSCSAPDTCVAVGPWNSVTAAEQWDGFNWTPSLMTLPATSITFQLLDVACALDGPCVGVGNSQPDAATHEDSLAEIIATTATTVSDSSSTTVPAEPVTYTATVVRHHGAPAWPLTGAVVFYDNQTPINSCGGVSGRPVAHSRATCTVTYATRGKHSLRAVYIGGAGSAPSEALLTSPHAVVRGSLTSTKLTSSSNPAMSTHSVSFTVKVSAASMSYGAMGGDVHVSVDHASKLVWFCATKLTSSLKERCTMPAGRLPTGTYQVFARYFPGSVHYAPSLSAVLAQVIG
jgi:hypothetical protein